MTKSTAEELPFLDGKFLVAMPGMGDPRFDRSVIYMCAHSTDGAMGLMINRAAQELDFKGLMKQLGIDGGGVENDPAVLFGGPVEHGRGFVLHSNDYEAEDGTMVVDDDFSMTATMDILRDMVAGQGPDKTLLCLGYAGWGPGQLENEIRANGWLICDADPAVVFDTAIDKKWTAATKSLGFDPALLSADGGRA